MISQLKAKVKKMINEMDKNLPRAFFHSFIMSNKEKKLFDNRIKDSKVYLEFGTGGSTFRVLQKSNAIVYSIDSSADWIDLMREYRQIRKAESIGKLSLFHVEIGPTREWGRPIGTKYKEMFPNYSSKFFNLIDKKVIDTVLIDGRFRVACALKTLLECYQNNNLQIIIHDFSNRAQYQVLLNYFDVVDKVESLVVLRIKNNIDINSISDTYELYKYEVD